MPNSEGSMKPTPSSSKRLARSIVEAGYGREITKYWKGVYKRLALDLSKSRKFRKLVTRQGNGRCPGM